MRANLRKKSNVKVLIIKGSSSNGTYFSFLETIRAFGLNYNKPITVEMILKRGDLFTTDYIKITKKTL